MTLRPIPGAPLGAASPTFPGSLPEPPAIHPLWAQAGWLKRLDDGYPPPRRTAMVPIEPPPKRGPTERFVMYGAENDPTVILFLTDMLGPMVGVETADRLAKGQVSGHYGNFEIDARVREAYGIKVCVWAPPDEAWFLVFQSDRIEVVCKTQPADDDLRKLIFVIGWWTIRTSNYATRGGWRRVGLTNTGELMRKAT